MSQDLKIADENDNMMVPLPKGIEGGDEASKEENLESKGNEEEEQVCDDDKGEGRFLMMMKP